jgi:hypothetical protein
MVTDAQVIADATQLESWLSRRDMKYLRNLNRYVNNGQRREQIWELYNNPVAYYYQDTDNSSTPWPIENVIKSCIDTKVSKMSQVKVRPYFNPVNGLWKTRKVCRVAQQWADEWYQRNTVYDSGTMSYRDAQVFEVGHVWVNEATKKPVRIKPWEYYIDPAEVNFKAVSRCMVVFQKYPLWALKDIIKSGTAAAQRLANAPFSRADKYRIYYHLTDGKRYDIIDGEIHKVTPIKFTRSPVATMYYCPPIKGIWSPSLVDDLITLQRELDLVNEKIHDAEENTPANFILAPTMGGIKASKVDAGKAGLLYEYEPVPGASSPATVVTPASVNAQLLQRRKEIIEAMYNISGVSMLSAQSKKPSGINSGVMLDTLEDVESERFNFELQNYERFCMDIAEIAIEVFDEDSDILPKRKQRPTISWKEIKAEREFYSIQFSPASALSNTPKVKLEQVEKLQKMGLIGPEWAAEMLQFPDLEKSYGIASANRDDIEMITERAAELGDFDFFEVVHLPDLYKNVMNEIMRLDADDENLKIIANLVEFLKILKGKMDDMANAAAPPVLPAPPPEAPPIILGQNGAPSPQAPNALEAAPPAPPPPPPPPPSQDPQLMQAFQMIASKIDQITQTVAQGPVLPSEDPQFVQTLEMISARMEEVAQALLEAKKVKMRKVTQYTRDANGELVATDSVEEPIAEESAPEPAVEAPIV